jgi:hypothetical protein
MADQSLTPAEERAVREGLPVVRLLLHDAMSVVSGHPLITTMADGGEALVRLFTPDEFLAEQHAVADKYGAPRVTYARAVDLTRPLELPS